MATFDVSGDLQRLGGDLAKLSERLADTCVKNALNRCADMVKTEAGRQIRQTYNVKLTAISKQMKTRYASASNLNAMVVTMGNAFPLIGFSGTRQNATGVQVQIKVGSAPKTITHAFIATMKSGHVGVMMRQGKQRLPIDEKFTLSLPAMFTSKKIMQASESVITANFGPRLEHEIAYQFSKSMTPV